MVVTDWADIVASELVADKCSEAAGIHGDCARWQPQPADWGFQKMAGGGVVFWGPCIGAHYLSPY